MNVSSVPELISWIFSAVLAITAAGILYQISAILSF
jgi:hypothetical protein